MYIRTIKKEVYTLEDLKKYSYIREKVLEKLWDINVNYEWWESIFEDAKQVDIDILSFNLDRGAECSIDFEYSCENTAELIISNHGEECDTYKLAVTYLQSLQDLNDNAEKDDDGEVIDDWLLIEEIEELDIEFKNDISHCYLSILRDEYDYLTSVDNILETIDINGYEFDENGNIV